MIMSPYFPLGLFIVVLQWWTPCVSGQVSLSLGSTPLANNSEVVITDIGDEATGGSPLICTTTFTPCCATHPNRHGQWYYPNGQVGNSIGGGDFYRSRGEGTVLLHRRNNALSPTGTYYCEIPGNSATDLQRLTVRVIASLPVFLTPSGTPTAGVRYQLTCTVMGSTDTPTITWMGPPSNTPLPSDTRMVSGVMSSGSTHTSILQFDPIQSSHEGMYTCQVTVGTVTEMRSTQVNVEELFITAMVSSSDTPTVGQSYSLTCTVTGADRLNPTITYQWFTEDNTVVSGETQSTLSFSSLSLSDAGQYRCDATVSSALLSNDITESSDSHELIIPTVLFQIRLSLSGMPSCHDLVLAQLSSYFGDNIFSNLKYLLVRAVQQACECGFTSSHITEDAFQCFPESQQHVTFRARLTETSQATTPQLITLIEQWVSKTQTIPLRSYRLGVNNTCDLVIHEFHDEECPMNDKLKEPPTPPAQEMTTEMFQIKFGPSDQCVNWNALRAKKIQTSIHKQLLEVLKSRCQCDLPRENLLNGVFSCQSSHNQTTYRSTIIGTQSHNATELVGLIQDWVTSAPTITIQWYTARVDPKCSFSISSLGDPECRQMVTEDCPHRDNPNIAHCVDVCIKRSQF